MHVFFTGHINKSLGLNNYYLPSYVDLMLHESTYQSKPAGHAQPNYWLITFVSYADENIKANLSMFECCGSVKVSQQTLM